MLLALLLSFFLLFLAGSVFVVPAVASVDHLEKRDGRWGIVERWAVREWIRQEGERLSAPRGTRARRDGTDPVDLLRARVLRDSRY